MLQNRKTRYLYCFHCLHFRSAPYDPYIPNSQRGAEGGNGQNKTARVQQQVDEVVGIMQENIDKVMQRGERLDDLRGKTGKVFFFLLL